MIFVISPLYTATMDLKGCNQDVIKAETFSSDSRGSTKLFQLTIQEAVFTNIFGEVAEKQLHGLVIQ